MARRPLIAGNWKMNLDHLEAIQMVQRLTYTLQPQDYDRSEIVVIPPFTDLRPIQTLIDGDRLELGLGAQNVFYEDAGAYTGEISPPMLARLKVTYVLCGHSERRQLFGETDEIVNRKLHAVLAHGLTPLLCVGETDEQREADETAEVVGGQVRNGLAGVDKDQASQLVVAYEPVWAIGTGKTATPDDANETCGLVRRTVSDLFGDEIAQGMRILYGGSVKPGNVADLMSREDIDGGLVGGASIDPDDFAKICSYYRL